MSFSDFINACEYESSKIIVYAIFHTLTLLTICGPNLSVMFPPIIMYMFTRIRAKC